MNKSSTQIRRLLISAFAALLFSGFASLKDQAEVIREVRPGNQPAYELRDSIDPNELRVFLRTGTGYPRPERRRRSSQELSDDDKAPEDHDRSPNGGVG